MIVLDFETRSQCDLRKSGASKYARHETTRVLCLVYSLPGQVTRLWTPEDPPPLDLLREVQAGTLIWAHNVGFEREIWHHICHLQFGWPDVAFDQWRCSMSECARMALPRGLEAAGAALELPIQKDQEGHRLMLRLCSPKRPSKKDPSVWDNTPWKLRRLYDYCVRDVDSQKAVTEAVERLPAGELKVWQLDQRINMRGIPLDIAAIENAVAVAEAAQQQLREELAEITHGRVTTPQQVAQTLKFLKKECGTHLADLTKATVEAALETDLPEIARRILEIRRLSAKSSTAKLRAMLDRADDDGRVRGNLVYHGAATGRWAGHGIQIQNFPRGSMSAAEINCLHDLLPLRDPLPINLLLGPPLDCLSSALRSMICAKPGHRLLVCDYASIEARVLAWLAGHQRLLDLFRSGADVYVDMASQIYGCGSEEVTKDQRLIGKIAILGLGYGMGHQAFRRTCKVVGGVEISSTFARRAVEAYRLANEPIKDLWRALNFNAQEAVATGAKRRFGRLTIRADHAWMRIYLPSGREIFYRKPFVKKAIAPWTQGKGGRIYAPLEKQPELEEAGAVVGDYKGEYFNKCFVPFDSEKAVREIAERCYLLRKEPEYIDQIEYLSVGVNRKFIPTRTYGGKLAENVTQAVARDFLAEAMLRVEAAGYPIVATVHDEIICEVPDNHGSLADFERIMKQIPDWGIGCPIDVEGFEDRRYRK
jgi:DNA polymerase